MVDKIGPEKIICLAISGASGFPYAVRLLQCLLEQEATVHLVISDAAREVARLEARCEVPSVVKEQAAFFRQLTGASKGRLYCYAQNDWLSPIASGSAPMDAMVVCPCSTGTLSAIANGGSDNLIERGATVALKEHRRLLIVPRETPVSAIQLEHMHKLACLGVRILPASPGFYHHPQTIGDLVDFVVARILQNLGLPNRLVPAWGISGGDGD